ncbi:S8 family peptidase [Erythrobacter sp. GH1-10]|uniref:S8 family peptidase n=1 Tax=Erythrobacter sp. GH1-10 TaxID=3349334 RepID=UPI0038783AC0
MTGISLAAAWNSPEDKQYSLPGAVMLKMALGEAPQDIPALREVSRKKLSAATSIDGGPIDRITSELAGGFRACRLHSAAASLGAGNGDREQFDPIEEATGLARTFVMRVPSDAHVGRLCETLRQIPTVESASPNYVTALPFDMQAPLTPEDNDDIRALHAMVHAGEALKYEPGDRSVRIGLIDSGISENHAELQDVFSAGYDTVQLDDRDVAAGVHLLGDHRRKDSNPTDDYVGHGMGCAGIIAAHGLRIPPGIGGQCSILPLRALAAARLPGKDKAVGLGAISDLDMALKLAVDLGAKVINMSFGTDDSAISPSSPRPHADTIEYAVTRGCILVAASGNNGQETRYWPAAYPEVIAVGAVDRNGRPAGFSTRGEHVALCAPGEKVLTTSLRGYQHATGTSFAAPFVSGAAALLVAHAHRRAFPVDHRIIKRVLMTSARPFGLDSPTGCGTGILDAKAALQALDREIDAVLDERPEDDGGADDG